MMKKKTIGKTISLFIAFIMAMSLVAVTPAGTLSAIAASEILSVSPFGDKVPETVNKLEITFGAPMDTASPGLVSISGKDMSLTDPVWESDSKISYTLGGLEAGFTYQVKITGFKFADATPISQYSYKFTTRSTDADTSTADGIKRATGNTHPAPDIPWEPQFLITDYGAVSNSATGPTTVGNTNKAAIQAAIDAAYAAGGGTVVVPSGNFRTYTVYLKDNVRLYLKNPDSVIQAGRSRSTQATNNDGGNYDAPESFFYRRLQDHGHSHYKNSLIVGYEVNNISIEGPGLIDGSWVNASGQIVNELQGNDPSSVADRLTAGTAGAANKAISIYKSDDVLISGVRMLNGGHFAIIVEGVRYLTVDDVLVDTNRDAFNIDCSQNVTVTNSVFNSLTDDAIVLKADFGAGRFMRTENVLIEDCIVSGYDAGSVLYGAYTTDKLVATDAGGPTARIKLGTEGTSGFDQITCRRVTFDRSRGFAVEAVDSADCTNIVLEDCDMYNISCTPIFIRVGDRSRAPVTGLHTTTGNPTTGTTIRSGNVNDWVLPNMANKSLYPDYLTWRYVPEYSRNASTGTIDNTTTNGTSWANLSVTTINQTAPASTNSVNINLFSGAGNSYTEVNGIPNTTNTSAPDYQDPRLFTNAVGGKVDRISEVDGVYIGNIRVYNADPRTPITLAGLLDGKIKNVWIEDVKIEYRGGLTMKDAVEQKQVRTSWSYNQYMMATQSQTVPWMINTFFLSSEGLLPRISWDAAAGGWRDDPYNIPERPREYPEPENFGILPAWGIWARHVENLNLINVNFTALIPDTRDVVVLDDVTGATFTNVIASGNSPKLTSVTNNFKRPTNLEFIPNIPYKTTTVSGLSITGGNLVANSVVVSSPEPGTPRDNLYNYYTYPNTAAPYQLGIYTSAATYSMPLTVHRPFFKELKDASVKVGETLTLPVAVRDPAIATTLKNWRVVTGGHYLQQFADGNSVALRDITTGLLPANASFNVAATTGNEAKAGRLIFTPDVSQVWEDIKVKFTITDGLLPVEKEISIFVEPPPFYSWITTGAEDFVTAIYQNAGAAFSGTFILAVYEKATGRMVYVEMIDKDFVSGANSEVFEVDPGDYPADAYDIKAFLWQEFIPLAPAVYVSVKNR